LGTAVKARPPGLIVDPRGAQEEEAETWNIRAVVSPDTMSRHQAGTFFWARGTLNNTPHRVGFLFLPWPGWNYG